MFSFRFWWFCNSKHTEGVPMAQLFATGIYTTIWTLPKKFCQILFHKQPAQDPAACRGECRLLFPWLLKYAGLRHFPGRRLTQTHAAESREKNRNPYAIPRLLYAPYDPCHFFSMPEKPCIFSALFRHTSPCVPLFPLLPSFPSCFTYIIKISQKI